MLSADQQLEEISKLGPEELGEWMIAIGRALLARGSQLVGSKADKAEDEPIDLKPEPLMSVGRFGRVVEGTAKKAAQQLGEFSSHEFADKIGLKPSGAQAWLELLKGQGMIERREGRFYCVQPPTVHEWVLLHTDEPFAPEDLTDVTGLSQMDVMAEIERLEDKGVIKDDGSGHFRYVDPPNDAPRSRPNRLPPEKERPAYAEARATGMPVRVSAAKKATRAQRSTAGAGGHKGFKATDRRYEEMQEKRAKRVEERKSKAQKAPKWQSRNGRRAA